MTERRLADARGVSPDAATASARAAGARTSPAGAEPLRLRANAFDPVQIRLDAEECRNLTRAAKKEWLLANGIGSFAATTVVGLNTRREHGLLVAPVGGGIGRAMVLSKMKETVHVPGASRSIDTSFYPGVVHPRGYELCTGFSRYPLPTSTFAGRRWHLERRVSLVHGEHAVVVRYRLLPAESSAPAAAGAVTDAGAAGTHAAGPKASKKQSGATSRKAAQGQTKKPPGTGGEDLPLLERVRLRVRPQFAFRALHDLARKNGHIQRNISVRDMGAHGSVMRCTPYPDWDPVYLVSADARFTEEHDWYRNVEYPKDRYRGLAFTEDLFSYGYFERPNCSWTKRSK